MTKTIFYFLVTALGVSACYQSQNTTDDVSDAGPSDDRCGEINVTVYLVPSMSCVAQSSPELIYEHSEGDLTCRLDVYASEAVPDLVMPEECKDSPFTSLCFLERIGVIDDVNKGLEGVTRFALEGYMRDMTVCELVEKGTTYEECREQEVFYPCTAEPR